MDMTFDLALGRSRTQKQYKNEKWSWSQLLKKLSEPVRTPETVEEYKALSKDKQAALKDVGGFIGGFLNEGSRKAVKHRQLICLDADFAETSLWDDWLLSFDAMAVMYSTRSHTAEKPRYRLIIPLSRPVTAEEYQPVARKIAETLGIEQFDTTTFEPGRIMYWPSASADGEYICLSADGAVVNPDAVLGEYDDWRDVSTWPVSVRSEKIRLRTERQMEAVTKKRGTIGAFCRAYSMAEAIEKFVPDYQPSDTMPNRYTYIKGHTSNGVVIYDDTYSYSHHDTDPASGVECNVFDLVRLHRFKDLDENAAPDTSVVKLPSHKAMLDFASSDDRCKAQLMAEMAEIANDFEAEMAEEEPAENWEKKLDVDRNGKVLCSYRNIQRIFRNDSQLRNCWGFDEFAQREVAVKHLPWRKIGKSDTHLKDIDDTQVRIHMSNEYGIVGKDKIWDCLLAECHRNKFHPIKEYLNGLVWDGEPRVDTLLIDYFGCDDTDYIRSITRKTLLGAVTRVYEPGCQFDTMLTLKGPQGCGKSSFFRKLSKGWFSDSLKDIRSKDSLEGLQGAWIIEMGELAALRKADAEVIKGFLSGTVDRFRVAYGRRTGSYPRQCIFVATTNEVEFLRDRTGNRRFWIADIAKSARPAKNVFKLSGAEVNQIWAEVMVLYNLGADTVVLPPELERQAIAIQEAYMQDDPRVGQIVAYLERRLPEDWDDMDLSDRQEWLASKEVGTVERTRVCAAEVWQEALGHSDLIAMNRYEAMEINRILDSLPEWEKQKQSMKVPNYGVAKGFRKV